MSSCSLLSGLPSDCFSVPVSTQEFATDPFTITILQTTDVHCQVHPHDELFWENEQAVFRKTGGYAHIATYLDEFRNKHPNTFVIDTGDMFQGSEVAVKSTGKALVPVLNELKYDLFLPGNWEVVYGKRSMLSLLQSLNGPTICANIYHDTGNGQRGELIFPPYHIWTTNGVRIGFIGYTDPLVPIRQSPAYSKGIVYGKPEENLASYVKRLRDEEGCVFLIVLSHLGLSQQIHLASLPECEGVDYILGGDTHERIRKPIQGKYAKIVEPGAFGSFVGKLELTIEKGRVISDSYELVEIDNNRFPASPAVLKIIRDTEDPFADELHSIAGYSTVPLYRYFVIENTIDTLIIDALKWKLKDVDIVLSNGFRFCPPKTTRDHTGNIPITNAYIFDMLPVDSPVRTADVTGLQLQAWMETELNNVFAKDASQRMGGWLVKFKGMKVEFNIYDKPGERVKKMLINNEPVQDDKIYKISACERDGDPVDTLCRMRGVANPANKKFNLHQVMKEYLRANSPVTPAVESSAIALDAPATLLTQVWGVDYRFL
ncbi:MAG TPA: 5'-nucleotidase C-terminal domain-containing protein [Flavitalea sp.]|nr:5'-nucleotidase C-terminal domain-containing protein [Flavitalea sp.]